MRSARPAADLRAGRNQWYRIENVQSDTTEIYIYDEIGYFGVTASDFVNELQKVRTPNIDLHLNTPGGDVFDGVAIYNALLNHRAEVTTYIDSLAASAGSFIAMAGNQRYIAKTGQMMIHDAHGLAIGNSGDMRELADLLDMNSDNIAGIYADRAGGTQASWRKAMKAETWYTAAEAVKAGLATEVMSANGQSPDNSWDLSVFNYAGRQTAPAPELPEIAQEEQSTIDPDEIRRVMTEVFQ
jgi:ATP-dependent protease ClpP protease subunit